MRFLKFLLINCISLVALQVYAQNETQECINKNYTFQVGEDATYLIAYNWFVVFADVGQVRFQIKSDTLFGKETIHLTAFGTSFSWWDNFFKVRDKYEVWVDPVTLRPYKFKRNVREGNYRQFEEYIYNHQDTVVYSRNLTNDNDMDYDTVKITNCSYDVLSALLYARNIDFSKYEKDEKIPLTIILDRELYDIYFRYKGVEKIKVKNFGEVDCIKFSLMLVESTVFHEGENMTMWVTNDKNRMPVYVESPILVGNIKARLLQLKGNRHPLTSMDIKK